jgi:putative peptide zinc metalloprotease protein
VVAQHRKTHDGETITVLKHPRRGSYFRLSAQGWFIWQRLDGEHSLRDLAAEYLTEFKGLAPGAIAEVIAGLEHAGLVTGAGEIRPDVPARTAHAPFWERALQQAQRLVDPRVAYPVDPLVTSVYRLGGRLLFYRPVLALLGLVAIIGLAAFVSLAGVTATRAPWVFVVAYFVTIVFHELAHALTTKWLGRDVGSAGLGWHGFAPIAYVDTSDVWLASRWQRIAVTAAGPFANLVLGGTASIAAVLSTDPAAAAALWSFALVPYLGALLTLNPLIDSDGYFVLCDLVGRPNLRRQALGWLGGEQPTLPQEHGPARGRAVELAYVAVSLAYVALLGVVTIIVCRATLQHWLTGILPDSFAAALTFAAAALVVVVALGAVTGELRRKPQAV